MPENWTKVSDRMPDPGKSVLACYRNRLDNWRIICAFWIPGKFMESSSDSEIGEYDEATDTYYDTAGWYEQVDNWGEYSHISVVEGEVSYWRMLPEFPRDDGERRK